MRTSLREKEDGLQKPSKKFKSVQSKRKLGTHKGQGRKSKGTDLRESEKQRVPRAGAAHPS